MSRRPANNIARLTPDVGPLTPSTPEQVEAVRQLLTRHQATDQRTLSPNRGPSGAGSGDAMKPYYEDEWVKLYHGDCLQVTEWLAADVLVTDPPYGIPSGRVGSHYGGRAQVHADAAWDSLEVRDAALTLWGDRPRAVFGSPHAHSPGHRGVPVIWEKGDDPGMGDPNWPFGPSYEVVWISGDGWRGKRRSSILRAPRLTSDASRVGHPTPKPVALMETLCSYAPPGIIADPFAGSGSTLVAAKALGRKAIGVELEERYAEIAARRLCQDVLDFEERVVKS